MLRRNTRLDNSTHEFLIQAISTMSILLSSQQGDSGVAQGAQIL
ncbi:MAG: hypothetical protein ACFFAV_15195 [Candidatus Hermodarchaeota archaeon]